MTNNDVLQTKYVVGSLSNTLNSISIGNLVHIVIKDVKQNMDTSINDAKMWKEETAVTINNDFDSKSRGTWTSTIEPDNVTVELDCVVVELDHYVMAEVKRYDVTANCGPDQWPDSVFNRVSILIRGVGAGAAFGYDGITNHAMFNSDDFPVKGLVPSGWSQYNVTGNGSNLTIGNQVTIMGLPESFVNHWVDMGAKAYMGDDRVLLVPPE